jgi:DNA-binding NarL/FixJ family response regulator
MFPSWPEQVCPAEAVLGGTLADFRDSPVGSREGGWHAVDMYTILIVDDHAPFRVQARALLEADGFTVVGESDTGATGLAAARTLKPYLVLLDIGLPDIEGFEVARELAADGPPPFVVLTSTREVSEYGPRLADSQVLGFIPKDELSGPAIRALADAR